MDPKKQLADLMDAFASAKASGNETLQRLVLQQVNHFFLTHDIVPIAQETPAPQASSTPEESGTTSWN